MKVSLFPIFNLSRTQVHDVSGQYYVPVLVHNETVLTETHEILSYLDDHSSAPPVEGK